MTINLSRFSMFFARLNKYKLSFLITLIGLLCTLPVISQSKNNIALWGAAGYSTFLTPSDDVFTKGNVGFDIGVGYELHYKRFLLQTGVEFGYYNARLGIDDFIHNANMIDTEGDSYIGNFIFTDNIDKYSFGNVNIPIMFGMQSPKLYFLLGGKVGINVMGKSRSEDQLKYSGTYDRYIHDFEDMPNHDFVTINQSFEYDVDFNINFAVSAEVGMYLGDAYKPGGQPKYRLALYADYGLLDVHNKSKKEDLILNKRTDPYYFPGLNSYMLANGDNIVNKNVNTLFVGLKFTVIFQLKNKGDCMCEEFLVPGSSRLWGVPWVGN